MFTLTTLSITLHHIENLHINNLFYGNMDILERVTKESYHPVWSGLSEVNSLQWMEFLQGLGSTEY